MNTIVSRARQCLGAGFRLHGRDPASGLDCVGLIAFALDRAADAPRGYAMRGGEAAGFAAMLDAAAMTRVAGAALAGDVLLMQPGPAQFHLALWTGSGIIHADARMRRVVEMPGKPPWRVIGRWRPMRAAVQNL